MLKYKQSTGSLFQFVDGAWVIIGSGYSGHGEGLNSHAHETIAMVGPIPCGLWSVSRPYDDPHRGNPAFRLVPLTYFGPRNGFLIHADNSKKDNSASEGCIILSPETRQKIVDAKVMYLLVEA